jgi:hypothetical protein
MFLRLCADVQVPGHPPVSPSGLHLSLIPSHNSLRIRRVASPDGSSHKVAERRTRRQPEEARTPATSLGLARTGAMSRRSA